MSDDITARDYWNTVEAIAKEVLDETEGNDDDAAYEMIHQNVDGSEWVIHNFRNRKVIEYTDNEDAWEEFGSDAFNGKSYSEITTLVAFCAMAQDVMDEYAEQRDKRADNEPGEKAGGKTDEL